MTIAANIGDVAILKFDACFPDSIVGLIPTEQIHQDFLYYALVLMKNEFLKEAPVNTQGNLNVERLGSSRIPVPPFCEQERIVLDIEESTLDFDHLIKTTLSEIEFIREYQTRLIADVVIGRLDVREAALHLPDDEDDVLDDFDDDDLLADENLDHELEFDAEDTENNHV